MDHGKVIALDTPSSLIRGLGGGLLRIGLVNGKTDTVSEEAAKLSSVKEISRLNGQLMIETHNAQDALLGVLEITNRVDARVTALEVLEPNLETVFLQLTGKSLRD